MARKGLAVRDEATEDFITVTEYQYEVDMEINAKQDAGTRQAILNVLGVLKEHNTDCIYEATEDEIDRALWVIALEIVKDMAILGYRLGTFTLPIDQCVKCGEEI